MADLTKIGGAVRETGTCLFTGDLILDGTGKLEVYLNGVLTLAAPSQFTLNWKD